VYEVQLPGNARDCSDVVGNLLLLVEEIASASCTDVTRGGLRRTVVGELW
jgi:hypothetical protein